MGSTFDILKVTPSGPVWVAAAQGLRQAEERMARWAMVSPGEYVIYSEEKEVTVERYQGRA